jgi:hypothetical protein
VRRRTLADRTWKYQATMKHRYPLHAGLTTSHVDQSIIEPTNGSDPDGRLPLRTITLSANSDHLVGDPWTVTNWIVARASSLNAMIPVSDDQLRFPTVLARAAATSDRLSSGRIGLTFGAGSTSADQLDAAIQIIREMFDLSDRRPLSTSGAFYHVEKAQRGPVPTRDIPIWITGATPELLRLAGQQADGWITPYANMRSADLAMANQVIDSAAIESGRDTREIQRAMVVDSSAFETSIDEFARLVLDARIGHLFLQSDDPDEIQHFLNVFMPEVLAAVDEIAPSVDSVQPIRRASIRAKRLPCIDYDNLPESLRNSAIEPGDVAYPTVRSTYIRGGAPGLVLRSVSADQVVEALDFARMHRDLPLSIRSAGHGISGRSTNTGGIVIDLSRMNAIDVLDAETGHVRLDPGARWMDVAAALAPHGLGLSSGDYGGVGVGGLATAGGIGWLARKHGLTIDHLIAVEIVMADGTIVRASEHEHPDLFWAIRGAGANFGIVTSFEFEAYPVGNVGFGQFVLDATDTAGFLETWGRTIEQSPRDLTSFLIMGPPRLGQPMVAQVMTVVASDDPEIIVDRLQPVANISSLYDQQVMITPYHALMANAQGSNHDAVGEPTARSGLIEHITPEFAAAAEQLIRSRAVYFFQIRSVGGAVSDVPADATAYANRSANFSVTAFGPDRDRVNQAWDELAHHFKGLYISFETDQRPGRLYDAFPGETLARLRRLKSTWDPENVFNDNFNVAVTAEVS